MGAIADWIEQYRLALEDEGFDIETLASFDADLEQVRQEYYDQGWSDGYEAAMEELDEDNQRAEGADCRALCTGDEAEGHSAGGRHHADHGEQGA